MEAFSKELDDLRFMMIRYPTVENVLAYKKKEAEMFNTAMSVDQSYRMARLVDPDMLDRLKSPMNLYRSHPAFTAMDATVLEAAGLWQHIYELARNTVFWTKSF